MPAAKIDHAALFQVAHGAAADVRLGDLVHEYGAHHPALHVALFQRVLQGDGVDDRGKHAHVVAAHPVHLPGLLFHAAEEIPATHHQADFDAQGMNLGQLAGNLGHFIGVQAKAALASERLSRKLEHDSFVHSVSSIAHERASAPHAPSSGCGRRRALP